MRISAVLLACIAFAALTGCGYRLGAAKPAILQNVTKIAIPTFKNKTFQPNVEVLMADTTIKQFQQDGTYEIVPDDRADAVLYCTLEEVDQTQARAVLSNVLATKQFNLRLRVQYELVDRVTGAKILAGSVTTNAPFFTNGDLQVDEQQAIVTAIQKVAVDICGAVSEGF
ncbi:MAG: LPS assembly lipoprotein LptE [Terrimicrobiaceae bacterium]|nr:LPS assembly lipoprotein LptE [Terrimicrobiaceae bacterium]